MTEQQPVATWTPPTPPTPAEVLRALRAPLLGFAATFAAAVVVVVLIAIASGVDSDNPSGVDSSVIQAIGVLVGMPVQLVAMSMFGDLHLTSDGATGSFLAAPLLLTAVYVLVTARAARRLVLPAQGTRALLAAAAGLVTAAVITPVTWALAMRDDGETMHAASPSLFLGAWALTAGAVFAGSARGSAVPRPAWLRTEHVAAARLWLQHVVAWVLVATPLIALGVGLDQGSWFPLVLPLWMGTLGLDTYALGHLGGIGFLVTEVHAWDFDAVWAVLMILGALLFAVLTAVAWHLRRDRRPERLAEPASWATLPVAWVAGSFVVWLLPGITIGGGAGEISASYTVRPSALVILLLAAFGAAIEGLSRTVAPALAGALPARLTTMLQGRAHPEPAASPASAPAQQASSLSPEQKRQWKRIGVAVGVLALLLGGAWIAISVINSSRYSAEATAERYLDALVDGDVDRLRELAPVGDEADDSLLTDAVYDAAEGRVTGYDIKGTENFFGTTVVTVELEGLDGDESEVELSLDKDGKTGVFFDRWRIQDGGVTSSTTIDLPEGSDGVTVPGANDPVEEGDYWLLPGSYAMDPYADSRWLEADDEPVVVGVGSGYADFDEPSASKEFVDTVTEQMSALLAACMASTELDPDGCPNGAFGSGDTIRKVRWTLTSEPELDLDYWDGDLPASLSASGGTASVTYEYDASYGFGPKDWQQESEEDTLYLTLLVEEDETADGGLKVTFDES